MKKFVAAALLLSFPAWCQQPHDQYSIEASYGLGISGYPGITGFSHYEIGFRYMVDQYWGIKFDYGSDNFRTGDNPELGSDYKRYSIQGVYNLGRALKLTNGAVKNINLLAHGGMGYSSLESSSERGVDNIGHVIVGLTPQLYLNNSLALMLDTSYTINFSQHYNFDGTHPPKPEGSTALPAFTSHVFNVSVGLTYYFGKNKSNTDWR